MNQLAKVAGVSVSTVSRALHGQPSIPEATRQRIQQLADRLGYRPDPMLDALGAYRRGLAKREYRPTLAVIASDPEWRRDLACRLYFEGARQRADALGYQLGAFVVAAGELSCQRLIGILETRGIRGVLVLPILNLTVDLSGLDGRFLVVAAGCKLPSPIVNRVSIDHFSAMGDAVRRLAAMGYRRPGLILRAEPPERAPDGTTHVGQLWKGVYLAECARQFGDLRIPVACFTDERSFERWVNRHKPDVLISQDRNVARLANALRCSLPIVYTMVDDDATLTGIHQNSRQVGRRAIDLIVADLYRSESDQTADAVKVLVATAWQEGTTAIPRR